MFAANIALYASVTAITTIFPTNNGDRANIENETIIYERINYFLKYHSLHIF